MEVLLLLFRVVSLFILTNEVFAQDKLGVKRSLPSIQQRKVVTMSDGEEEILSIKWNSLKDEGGCQGLRTDITRARSLENSDKDLISEQYRVQRGRVHIAKEEKEYIVNRNNMRKDEETCELSRSRLEDQIFGVPIHGSTAIVTYRNCKDDQSVVVSNSIQSVRGKVFTSVFVSGGYEPTNSEEALHKAIPILFGSSQAQINGKVQLKVFVSERGDYLAYFTKVIIQNNESDIEVYDSIIDAHTLSLLSVCSLVENFNRGSTDDNQRTLRESQSMDKDHRSLQCGVNCDAPDPNAMWSVNGRCNINSLYLHNAGKTITCKVGRSQGGKRVTGPGKNASLYWESICDCDSQTSSCFCDPTFRECADSGYDVQFAGEKTMEFLQTKLGFQGGLSLGSDNPQWVGALTHYDNEMCNAFCCLEEEVNGKPVNFVAFGNCNCNPMGPLVTIDIVAHEIVHGVTEHTSALEYDRQSGGLNEGYSDIAGTMMEFDIDDTNDTPDFLIGEMIGSTLRNMEDPPSDGVSIDNVCDYFDGLQVHRSSGVLNKAFVVAVRACESNGCDSLRNCVLGMGSMFMYANIHGLTTFDGYLQAATATCELVDEFVSALSPTLNCTERQIQTFVVTGWAAVGVPLDQESCSLNADQSCIDIIPANDRCGEAVPLPLGSAINGTTRSAFPDNAAFCGTTNTAPGVWFTINGTGSALVATTCSSAGYDTKISVYSGSCFSLICVGGNDDWCGLRSAVTWLSEVGIAYYILVHGYGTSRGNFELIVQSSGPTNNPTSAPSSGPTSSTPPSTHSPSIGTPSSIPTLSQTNSPSISSVPSSIPTSSPSLRSPTGNPTFASAPSSDPTSIGDPTGSISTSSPSAFVPNDNPTVTSVPSSDPTSNTPTLGPTTRSIPTRAPITHTRPPSSFCFSPYTVATVEGKGVVAMKDVVVGDKVLTASGDYRTVYTIQHYHHSKPTNYLRIHTTGIEYGPLELSHVHMIFVRDKSYPIIASDVKVGDYVQTIGGAKEVMYIDTITRNGLYNPITTDGTIVVNGIVASTYSSPLAAKEADSQRAAHIEIAGCKLISIQALIHMTFVPYRTFCVNTLLDYCNQHAEDDIPRVSQWMHQFYSFWSRQRTIVKSILFLIYIALFGLASIIFSYVSFPLVALTCLLGWFLFNHKKCKNNESARK